MDALQELREKREETWNTAYAIVQLAENEKRDLTLQEDGRLTALNAEIDALDERIKHGEEREQRDKADKAATEDAFRKLLEQPPVATPASTVLAEVDEMIREGRAGRVKVELRAISSANAGARTDVDAGGFLPPFVHEQAQIPFESAEALTIQGPRFPALTAVAATAEGGTKPVATDPTLNDVTLSAFAEQTLVSDQVIRFGTGQSVYSQALTADVIAGVNAHVVDTIEAGATAQAFAVSAQQGVDTAIANVSADTGNVTAILINPADYHLLTDKQGIGDRPDSAIRAWNGVPLVVSDAADVGFATVLNGAVYRLHGTSFIFRQQDVVGSNERALLVEMYAALIEHRAGAAIKADIISP